MDIPLQAPSHLHRPPCSISSAPTRAIPPLSVLIRFLSFSPSNVEGSRVSPSVQCSDCSMMPSASGCPCSGCPEHEDWLLPLPRWGRQRRAQTQAAAQGSTEHPKDAATRACRWPSPGHLTACKGHTQGGALPGDLNVLPIMRRSGW